MSSIAGNVRIECVAQPGGWECNAACVCSSEYARRCETRTATEFDSSDENLSVFVETPHFFENGVSRNTPVKRVEKLNNTR